VGAMAFLACGSSFPRRWGRALQSWGSWTGLLLLALQLGQSAGAQETQVWIGTGQILSGQGQGATVQLVLETGGGRIWSQSGPALDAPFSGEQISVTSGDGTWQIQPQGDQLVVTFYRGEQIIRWQLRPVGKVPTSSSPLPPASWRGETPQPLALPKRELVLPVLNLLRHP